MLMIIFLCFWVSETDFKNEMHVHKNKQTKTSSEDFKFLLI